MRTRTSERIKTFLKPKQIKKKKGYIPTTLREFTTLVKLGVKYQKVVIGFRRAGKFCEPIYGVYYHRKWKEKVQQEEVFQKKYIKTKDKEKRMKIILTHEQAISEFLFLNAEQEISRETADILGRFLIYLERKERRVIQLDGCHSATNIVNSYKIVHPEAFFKKHDQENHLSLLSNFARIKPSRKQALIAKYDLTAKYDEQSNFIIVK